MRFALLFFFMLVFSLRDQVRAQALGTVSTGLVTGIVLDSTTRQPVAFASVVLLTGSDPAKIIAGQTADEHGHFAIENIQVENYRFHASFLNYRTTTIQIKVNSGLNDLGAIFLAVKAHKLSEAVITAQKPLIEAKADRLVYNAELDVTNSGGSTQDILRKVPLLSVDGEGNVSMRGSSNFRVFINNRPSPTMAFNLAEALKSLPANRIKSVEVITNPSAKYDGEGTAGIINIVLKKELGQGLNGNVGVSSGNRTSNIDALLNQKKGKINVSLSANQAFNYNYLTDSNNEIITRTGSTQDTLRQKSSNTSRTRSSYAALGVDYDLNEHNSLSFSSAFFHSYNTSSNKSINQYSAPSINNSSLFLRDYLGGSGGTSFEATGAYVHNFPTPHREWSIVSQYAYNRRLNNYEFSQYDNTTVLPDIEFAGYRERSLSSLPNYEFTLQSDYTHPFANGSAFDVGLKAIWRNTRSVAEVDTLYQLIQTDYAASPYRGTYFSYKQNVQAAYAIYNAVLSKKLKINIGARVERTEIEADFKSANTDPRCYTTFLPNINASYALNETNIWRVAYSRRISRPYILYLNPYVNRGNPILYFYGNPNLDPELTHLLEISHSIFIKKLTVNSAISMRYTGNGIENISFSSLNPLVQIPDNVQTAPDLVLRTYANIASNANYQLSSYSSLKINPKLDISGGGNAQYIVLHSTALNLNRRGWTGNFNLNTSYKIMKTLTLQANVSQSLKQIILQGYSSSINFYSFGCRKALFNDRGNLAFVLVYPFTSTRILPTVISTSAFNQYSDVVYLNQRQIRVAFNYRFGQQYKRSRKNVNNDDIKKGGDATGN
jgi:hypothetical protein